MANKTVTKVLAEAQRDYGSTSKADVSGRSYLNYAPNLTIRSDLARSDYEKFRPAERVPTDPYEIMDLSIRAAEKVGIIGTVMDLMAEFSSYGIYLSHENKTIERFYQKWFSKVDGEERSERFCDNLYKAGNIIIQRVNGQITPQERNSWKKVSAAKLENDISLPLKYVIHNPLSIDVAGGEIASFIGKPFYSLRLPNNLIQAFASIAKIKQSNEAKQYIDESLAKLPPEIRQLLKTGGSVPLPQDDIIAYHYKKNDWEVWAKGIIYRILDDIFLLEKTKLADMAALDGIISNIRLWNVGIYDPAHPQNNILPTKTSLNKLRNLLASNVGGGVMDLVWGPELRFTESKTESYKFLGVEKYQARWNDIYEGLGIPPTLTGSSQGSGFTNNSVSLNTFIKRMEYGRCRLVDFWKNEISIIQKAMGFIKPAEVNFAFLNLSEESAIKTLLIQLVDRNIISEEAARKAFGFSNLETSRVNREDKIRVKRKRVKVTPFSILESDLRKIALQSGQSTPSEVGLDLFERKPGEIPTIERKQTSTKPKGDPFKGRPVNSKDSVKRKQKTVKPLASISDIAKLFIWTENAQKAISEHIVPYYLSKAEKKNMRQLTTVETNELENLRFNILTNLAVGDEITAEKLLGMVNLGVDEACLCKFNELVENFQEANLREPTIDEIRQLQVAAYVEINVAD